MRKVFKEKAERCFTAAGRILMVIGAVALMSGMAELVRALRVLIALLITAGVVYLMFAYAFKPIEFGFARFTANKSYRKHK